MSGQVKKRRQKVGISSLFKCLCHITLCFMKVVQCVCYKCIKDVHISRSKLILLPLRMSFVGILFSLHSFMVKLEMKK